MAKHPEPAPSPAHRRIHSLASTGTMLDEQQGSLVYLVVICFVATLGGLLFGYDTAVIAGAIRFLTLRFDLSPVMEGWTAASALAGCAIGAMLAGIMSDSLGRKKVLISVRVLFIISALGTALPRESGSSSSIGLWEASESARPPWPLPCISPKCPRPGSADAWCR